MQQHVCLKFVASHFFFEPSQNTRNRAEAEACNEVRLVLNQYPISLWVVSGLIYGCCRVYRIQ